MLEDLPEPCGGIENDDKSPGSHGPPRADVPFVDGGSSIATPVVDLIGTSEAPVAMAAAVPQVNERLINSVAVGVVIVAGTTEGANLSLSERLGIAANIFEGLDWLAGVEPAAKVKWHYDLKAVTVDVDWWKGARWPGMPEAFYVGIDAAVQREDNEKSTSLRAISMSAFQA